MTRFSYNGWPVIEEPDADRLTEVVRVGGRAFRFARGDVARVFEAFLTRFVAEVEPLVGGELDDWSYAVRLTRGSTTSLSCHASATACDLNSLAHPRGVKGTFGAKEKPMRALLADFPVLRWGEDFRTAPTDSMHVEINATPAEVAAFVKTLTTPVEDDMPTADEIAAAVWGHDILRRETDDPKDTIPAGDALGYAARFGYVGLSNDRAEVGRDADEAGRDAALVGRVVGLEQGQNSILELLQSLTAKVDALAPPVAP